MHIPLCKYPKETAAILTRDIFWFFMTDNEFIAKTINEGNMDHAQYPAAKVQQMAKKLESRKATAKHIKQHISSMQGTTQINVLCHNHTSLPPMKKKGSKHCTKNRTLHKNVLYQRCIPAATAIS